MMWATMSTRIAAVALVAMLGGTFTAAQSTRRLDTMDRAAVLALITAVDAAQASDASHAEFSWDHHAFKSVNETAFVPLRVTPPQALRSAKGTLMYVRAVSRHDGIRSTEERSFVRDWLMTNPGTVPSPRETVFIGPGELPVGGPAASSSRASIQAANEASTRLAMHEREYEKDKPQDGAKKSESKERDPFRFPFEEYYPVGAGPVERAIALPAGEYDVFIALVDRAHLRTAPPVVSQRTLVIPNYWNDQLTLSTLILASEVKTLHAPLSKQDQNAHPYTFGYAQVVPAAAPEFSRREALSIVYQICNYGAPDTDLVAHYAFYRVDGERRLFNRTQPQPLTDDDLPKPTNIWETQAFTMQAVPLQPFAPGSYELEVTVRDNLTRATATARARFSVKP
jgi:hypothetical protein